MCSATWFRCSLPLGRRGDIAPVAASRNIGTSRCACAGRESSSGREGAKVSERIKVETTVNYGRCYGLNASMRAYIDRGTQAPSSKL